MEAIRIEALSQQRCGRQVLSDLELEVRSGEMFALLGPNAAGKSTLLSLLSTLLRPSRGRIRLLGHDTVTAATAVRRCIGVVFQGAALEPRLSAWDNLCLIARCYGLSTQRAQRRCMDLLVQSQMEDLAHVPVQRLSGSQQRRLELLRACLAEPRVLLLDEATQGLDLLARQAFWRDVRGLQQQGCTVFYATHYLEEAMQAERIGMLQAGRLIACDSPQALLSKAGGTQLSLEVEDIPLAMTCLQQQGHNVVQHGTQLLLSCSDSGTVLPGLIASLPCAVRRADVLPPSLESLFVPAVQECRP